MATWVIPANEGKRPLLKASQWHYDTKTTKQNISTKIPKKKKKKYGPFARQHFLQEWAIRGICKFIFRLSLKRQRKKKIIKKEKRMTSCINLQFHFLGFQIMDTKGSINLHNYILNIKQRDTDLYNPRMPSSCAILFKAENMPL